MKESRKIINIVEDEIEELTKKADIEKDVDKNNIYRAKIEILKEVLEKLDEEYEPIYEDKKEVVKAIRYYEDNMKFNLEEESKKQLDIIIEYLKNLMSMTFGFLRMADRQYLKAEERKKEIKLLRSQLKRIEKTKQTSKTKKKVNKKILRIEEFIEK